jgi:hypothetical protein
MANGRRRHTISKYEHRECCPLHGGVKNRVASVLLVSQRSIDRLTANLRSDSKPLTGAGTPVAHPRNLNFYKESTSTAPTVFKSRTSAISTFRENASKCHNNEIFLDIKAIGDLESP